MKRRALVAVMTGALCGMVLSPAGAFDLTGTWQGK